MSQFDYNKKHNKIEYEAPTLGKTKLWNGGTEENVYKEINRIQEIKNVDEKVDTGLNNKPISAVIEFKERISPENYLTIRKMLWENHNANRKMWVQKQELKDNKLILTF